MATRTLLLIILCRSLPWPRCARRAGRLWRKQTQATQAVSWETWRAVE